MHILRAKINGEYGFGEEPFGKTDLYNKEVTKTHIDTAKQAIKMTHPKYKGKDDYS
jgi:hypothetical protein